MSVKSQDFLSSIVTFGHVVSEEKSFELLANQKHELPVATIFVVRAGCPSGTKRGNFVKDLP